MRRIYESNALHRDDEEQFTPHERDRRRTRPQAIRSIDSTAWSRRLVPRWLGHRAIAVSLSTPETEYQTGDGVPFTVTMKNTFPIPITVETISPVLWTWEIDGATEAARVSTRNPPDETGSFTFDRGERKQFAKRWSQFFQVSEDEWEPAEPGTYTLAAGINVENPDTSGLSDEITIQIVDE